MFAIIKYCAMMILCNILIKNWYKLGIISEGKEIILIACNGLSCLISNLSLYLDLQKSKYQTTAI